MAKIPSKLDVLIQTATSADLDSFVPKKRKYSSSLEYLCDQAEKELNSSSGSLSSVSSTDSSHGPNSSNLTKRLNPGAPAPVTKKNKKSAQSKRNSNPKATSKMSAPALYASASTSGSAASSASLSNHLAIKLASPSTHTKRQRSGPSCDCCRSRKIKCDSEIFILSSLDSTNLEKNTVPEVINSHIAHCQFISTNLSSGYQYYKIIKDEEHALNNKLTSFNYLQFKPCSACITKNLKCCFSKGFTRNDIIKFNKFEKLNGNNNSSGSTKATVPTITTPDNNTPVASLTNSISENNSILPSPATSIPTSPPSQVSQYPLSDPTFISNKNYNSNNNSNNDDDDTKNTTSSLGKTDFGSLPSFTKTTSLPTPSPTPASINLESNNYLIKKNSNISAALTLKSNQNLDSKSSIMKDIKLKDVNIGVDIKEIKGTKEKKSSKKTSCKTCRFKKIKCVKVDGSDSCVYCNKKSVDCFFE